MSQKYNRVATGRRMVLAMGVENDGFARGTTTLTSHDPVLPSGGRMMAANIDNPAVNRSGVKSRGIPGPMSATYAVNLLLSPGDILPFGFDMFGGLEKVELHPGVFHYRFYDPGDEPGELSFAGVSGLPPLHREQFRGARFEQMVVAAAESQVVQAALTGQYSHGSTLGPAEPDVANTGTSRPLIAGHQLRNVKLGDVFVRIERAASGGGVQFQVLQTLDEVPAWPGSPIVYDVQLNADGDAKWQWTTDQNGEDLGKVDHRFRLPIELLFGSAADLAGYAVGDVFRFRRPGTWVTPAVATPAPGTAFTLADLKVFIRPSGSVDDHIEIERRSGTITLTSALIARRESSSQYLSAYSRTGAFTLALQLVRTYSDRILHDAHDADELLDLKVGYERRMLHPSSGTREAIWWTCPAMQIKPHELSASDEGPVVETSTLEVVEDPAVSRPIEMEVITDVDWTPPAP